MSSKDKNLSVYDPSSIIDAKGYKIGIVVAEWNHEITHALYQGCLDTLQKHGVENDHIHVIQVPGTFELPQGAKILNKQFALDATVCIGCVIKGETSHNEYINMSVAQALQHMSILSSKPFVFGVLTPNSMEQAKDRAGGKYGNKGIEAAVTALRMVQMAKDLAKPSSSIGFGK